MFGPGFLGSPKEIRTGLGILGLLALLGLGAIVAGLAFAVYYVVQHLQWVP